MDSFKDTIIMLANMSVAFTAIQIYLQINKIWKRKHEREVADSQSITGLITMMITCVISILYYIINDHRTSLAETSLYLFQAILLGMISTGLFVKSTEKLSLWRLMRKAFSLERKEASYLIKKFLKPTNAESIIKILHQLAMIDNELAPKEEELIRAFAEEWKIEYSVEKYNQEYNKDTENHFIQLRTSVQEYLDSDPPKEQAAQLRDMMQALIQADDKVSAEEELMSSELMGLIATFLDSNNISSSFEVLIVPQKSEHHAFVKQILPGAKIYEISGGVAYSMGQFYSHKYAEMICDQYREVNLFTIVHAPNLEKKK